MIQRAKWTIPGNVRAPLEGILRGQGLRKKKGEDVFVGHGVEIDYGAGDAPNTTNVRLSSDDPHAALTPYAHVDRELCVSLGPLEHRRDASLDLALHLETLRLFARNGIRYAARRD